MKNICRVSGFTLVEFLVAMAIIIVLVGLIVPSLGGSRHKAGGTHAIQYLRQAGMAAEMYSSDHGFHPYDHNALVAAGYLAKEVVSVPNDATANGWGHQFRYAQGKDRTTPFVPYKDSLISIADAMPRTAFHETMESRNGGWLITWNGCTPVMPPYDPMQHRSVSVCFKGPYLRLRTDGSVISRQVHTITRENGTRLSISMRRFFTDQDFGTRR
ncbi:type II secretion system protein [Kamptonema cortianum]|nr:type II secretion system protein [Geitlerinema splendidum]MDK3156970.1 type II secretion system protein [Kamptonema cortianum]